MNKFRLGVIISLLLIAISIVGIVDSSYITYEKLIGDQVACGQGFDCDSVLNSQWANLGPFPISILGMIFYTTVFILSVLHFLEIRFKNFLRNPLELLFIMSTIGGLFSLYLIFIMAFVIKAWCLFCIISAVSSMSLFFLTLIYIQFFTNHTPFLMRKIVSESFAKVYSLIIKKVFFSFNPEPVHDLNTKVGEVLGRYSITQNLTRAMFNFSHPTLEFKYKNITFPNPIGLAAGFDYNGQLTQILPDVGFGFHTIGTITLLPYEGNPKPRLTRLQKSKSILVNKGLKNWGANIIISYLEKHKLRIPTGISIASTNKLFKSDQEQILDILHCFKLFEKSQVGHSHYELNISCPNTFGGEPFTTPKRLSILLDALDKLNLSRPVFIKMPIDQDDQMTLDLLAEINKHNIDGVVFGNLTKNHDNPRVHPADKKVWNKMVGNLSGKPTFDRSNHLISLTKKRYKSRFVIIGTGGVFSGEDALNKIKLGADLIQLITGMIYQGPQLIGQINLKIAEVRTK